jgi:putative zinc ribbon protein
MEQKICESCGMPMKNIEDFGGRELENKYCKYCTDNRGNLKSYSEKLTNFKELLIKSNDLDAEQTERISKEKLKQFPAWENIEL